MQYLPLFLLMMAVLIAAYFYLERAKVRDGDKTASASTSTAASASTDASAAATPAAPTDRPAE